MMDGVCRRRLPAQAFAGGRLSKTVVSAIAATNGEYVSCPPDLAVCQVTNLTRATVLPRQTSSTTSSVTLKNYNAAGTMTPNWTSGDKLNVSCQALLSLQLRERSVQRPRRVCRAPK